MTGADLLAQASYSCRKCAKSGPAAEAVHCGGWCYCLDCAPYQPHSAYAAEMAKFSPHGDQLRGQDRTRPLVGDLIKPGMLVESSYGTGPYMVVGVREYQVYPEFAAWSLSMRSPERDGTFLPGDATAWINEVVVEWEGDVPRFRKLFACNTDEVTIVQAQAFACDRRGQGLLL